MKIFNFNSFFLLSCDDLTIEIIVNYCSGEFSTANVLTDIDENIFNDNESVNTNSIYSWTSDGSNRVLNGNVIPNHDV